uniref:G-protein coupled receptors family 1 profile domain-containing protein n=1 Tax=Esox lucius TaxID=8010 RepID=A0A3P8Y9T6_ESOLU
MDVSIPSILLGLGGKAVMGLALLLFHRSYLNHSFLGVFSLSLTLVDTLLSLFLSALYFQENMSLLGLHFTRHHICLLAQIAGFTYNCLLWPVAVVTGLDHFWTNKIQGPAVCLLWIVALVYVILGSGLIPVLGNQSPYQLNRCWVFTSAHTRRVDGTLLLTLACALVYTDRQGRAEVVHQLLWIFLNTWALFLVFLIVCLVCQVEIPGYLGLNVPWLCLLNSFLLGVVLCVRCPAPKLAQGSVTTDGFCNWSLSPVESQCAEKQYGKLTENIQRN